MNGVAPLCLPSSLSDPWQSTQNTVQRWCFIGGLYLLMRLCSCTGETDSLTERLLCVGLAELHCPLQPNYHIHTFFKQPYELGALCVGEWSLSTSSHKKSTFLFRVQSVSWVESNCSKVSVFALFPSLIPSSLPLRLSGQLNSGLHPLFLGALSVARTVTPKQGLGLK